jgi:hypothetical protein
MVTFDILMSKVAISFLEVELANHASVAIMLFRFTDQRGVPGKEIGFALSPRALDKFLLLPRGCSNLGAVRLPERLCYEPV